MFRETIVFRYARCPHAWLLASVTQAVVFTLALIAVWIAAH
jgi:hypothetical protein